MDAKKQKIEKVSKPYIKGDMIDKTTMPGALKFFGGTVTMAVIFLIMGVMMNMETLWINIAINVAIVLAAYMFFQQIGL